MCRAASSWTRRNTTAPPASTARRWFRTRSGKRFPPERFHRRRCGKPRRRCRFGAPVARGMLAPEAAMTPWRQTLGDILRRSAARDPRKTAVICGGLTWTFAEFDGICDRLAAGLAGIGVQSGDRVAILSRNSHAFAALRFSLARLGAVLTHEAVLWEYVSCVVEGEIATTDRVLHALPLYHCTQLDVFLGPSVYVGATSVITGKPTPDNILALLEKHGCNSFFAPPSIWIALLRSPAFDKTDLTRLAKGYYGASIMPVAVLEEIGRRLPKVRLWNFYGQTEIAPLATVLKPEDQVRKAGSAGRAVLNVETRVVDDRMEDVGPGEVGEIVHRSPQLQKGYFNDEERTDAAFAGGWFHSGDLATIDEEGYITVVDRKKA